MNPRIGFGIILIALIIHLGIDIAGAYIDNKPHYRFDGRTWFYCRARICNEIEPPNKECQKLIDGNLTNGK